MSRFESLERLGAAGLVGLALSGCGDNTSGHHPGSGGADASDAGADSGGTSANAGMWPLLTARVVAVLLFGAATIYAERSYRMPTRVLMTAVAGGILDMLANVLYLLAARNGPLTLVVTLSSLYPASTVLLARMVLGERITPRQWIGVVFALTAIAAIVSA